MGKPRHAVRSEQKYGEKGGEPTNCKILYKVSWSIWATIAKYHGHGSSEDMQEFLIVLEVGGQFWGDSFLGCFSGRNSKVSLAKVLDILGRVPLPPLHCIMSQRSPHLKG